MAGSLHRNAGETIIHMAGSLHRNAGETTTHMVGSLHRNAWEITILWLVVYIEMQGR